MKRFARSLVYALPLFLVLTLAPAYADDAVVSQDPVLLKANPSVIGASITLGDLFENVGAAASVKVASAPLPGQALSIDARSLADLAEENGLHWANAPGYTSVTVTREARQINSSQIADAIAKALSIEDGGRDLDVRMLQSQAEIDAAADDPSPLQVKILSFDSQSGRFQAEVSAPGGGELTIIGTAEEAMSVPVLARPFQRGEVISQNDIDWVRMRIDSIGRQVITDPSALVGFAARRPLRSGQPLAMSDIQRPTVVAKGALVTMRYRIPGMVLTDIGRALDSGAAGETISVLNERSHRTIQAMVVSANEVELSPSTLALSEQASNAP